MEKTAIKYHCGCGKAYTSYPAYSMHKKHKHNNIAVPGTRLPNHYCPKRGRPSSPLAHRRPLPRRSHPLALPLHALTALETSLLRLEEAYPPLLSDPEEETDIAESCRQLRELEKEASSQAGVKLVQAVAKFLQAVGTHLSETLASGVAQYLQLLTPYLLENLPA